MVLAAASAAMAEETKKTAEKPAEKADPFAVPSGTPEELLKYIDGLKQLRPTSDSREVEREFLEKQCRALLEASERVIAGKPNLEQGRAAVQYKLVALRILGELGDADAEEKMTKLPASLEKAGLKQLAREARYGLLFARLEQAADLNEKGLTQLLKEIKQYLSEGQPDAAAADLAMEAAMGAENSGNTELAKLAYTDFGRFLAKSTDRKISNLAASMTGAARRLGLIGKEMKIEGTTAAGKPFHWSKYKGKVVLVQFFATWCAPCRAEMVNIARNYKNYHDRGFDVVGISVDESRKALTEFLEQNKLPWTVLLDNTEANGTDKSMSTYYGAITLPKTILVGADGKVVALDPRGPELRAQLEKLLGPVDTKADKKKPSKDKAADKEEARPDGVY